MIERGRLSSYYGCVCDMISILCYPLFFFQIFTNADTGHAFRVLQSLGLEDCFESIISFDTLNSFNNTNTPDGKDGSETRPNTAEIFDFCEYMRQPDSDMVLPRTPVVCKPFQDAFEKVFKLADIDPLRTVRAQIFPSLINRLALLLCLKFEYTFLFGIFLWYLWQQMTKLLYSTSR